jgi:hypothetical protein
MLIQRSLGIIAAALVVLGQALCVRAADEVTLDFIFQRQAQAVKELEWISYHYVDDSEDQSLLSRAEVDVKRKGNLRWVAATNDTLQRQPNVKQKESTRFVANDSFVAFYVVGTGSAHRVDLEAPDKISPAAQSIVSQGMPFNPLTYMVAPYQSLQERVARTKDKIEWTVTPRSAADGRSVLEVTSVRRESGKVLSKYVIDPEHAFGISAIDSFREDGSVVGTVRTEYQKAGAHWLPKVIDEVIFDPKDSANPNPSSKRHTEISDVRIEPDVSPTQFELVGLELKDGVDFIRAHVDGRMSSVTFMGHKFIDTKVAQEMKYQESVVDRDPSVQEPLAAARMAEPTANAPPPLIASESKKGVWWSAMVLAAISVCGSLLVIIFRAKKRA